MPRLTRRQLLAAAVLSTVAAAFIVLDLTGGSLAEAHGGARGVLGGLYRGSDTVLGPARRYVQALPGAAHDSAQVRSLQQQNAALKSQLAANADNAGTSADLAALNLAAGAAGMTIVPAKVIAFGPGQGFDWTITIDVGSSSGVTTDQTVTSAGGLVGRVLHADKSTAVVLMAVDPGSGVGVRDVRSGELALATGAGTAGFSVTPLSPVADLKAGDQLETGPAGSSTYAAGLRIASIATVHTTATGTISATARSAITPTTVDLVGVILSIDSTKARAPLTGATTTAAPR